MIADQKYYVFLDEVQEGDGFENVVNFLNAKAQADALITGSNFRLLSGELATYLTGRFYTVEVLPLSFGGLYNAPMLTGRIHSGPINEDPVAADDD